jgi:hypothetical protein
MAAFGMEFASAQRSVVRREVVRRSVVQRPMVQRPVVRRSVVQRPVVRQEVVRREEREARWRLELAETRAHPFQSAKVFPACFPPVHSVEQK